MAIGVSTAVAVASATGYTVTTGSFTPAVGELLVCCVAAESPNSGTAPTISVADSLSGSWTKRAEANRDTESGGAGTGSVWTRPVSSATSMTVTMSGTPTGDIGAIGGQVYRVTSGGSFVLGATGHGRSTDNNITPTIFTSTVADSVALVAGSEWFGNGAPTSSDLTATTYHIGGHESAIFGYKTLGATGAKTANLDAGGTGPSEWMWAALEIGEDTGATVTPAVVTAVAAVPAATVSGTAGATVTPATVTTVAAVPAATVAGHVTIAPTAVAAVAAVPAATVQNAFTRLFTGTLEVELTAGNWTDITTDLSFEAGPLRVRQGRPTEYDDPAAAVLTFALWNDSGKYMPGNTASSIYPNWVKGKRVRWKVTQSGATYTRFVGWIQAIAPEFPGDSTVRAIVNVTATDALGLLAQRKLRSNLTEVSLWRARNDGTWCDAYEANGETTGQSAFLTNCSNDASPGAPRVLYGAADTSLTFGSDNDMSIGGVVTASSTQTCKTITEFQANPLQIKMHIKGSTQAVTAGTFYKVTSFVSAGPANHSNLCISLNGSANGLFLRNGANTSSLGFFADLPFGQWVEVVAYSRAANPARSDWYLILADGTAYGLSDIALDIRDITEAWFPGTSTPSFEATWGGVIALGTRSPINYEDAFVSGTNGSTVSTRLAQIEGVMDQLPVSFYGLGSLTTPVMTGRWSDRSALEVHQELLRTGSGTVWARGRDSDVLSIEAAQLYPTAAVATIDTDADCLSTPRLVDAAESSPTRVDVTWPGGTVPVIDSTAEAGGVIRSRTVSTVAGTATQARAVGQAILDRSDPGVRISQVTVDLLASATDHTVELFSEATNLGGLFPTQRIRLVVPTSHFGVPTQDVHVQGWTEDYSPNNVSITMDTTPAIASTLATETWTGANGAAWPAQWTTYFGTGSTRDIQSNRGRVVGGSDSPAGERMNSLWADVEISGRVHVIGTAEAQIWWRATSGLANGYALVFSVANGVRVQQRVSGSISTRYSGFGGPAITAGVDYRYRIRHQGTYLSIRAWAAYEAEPRTWQLNVIDTLHTAAGYVACAQWYTGQTCYHDDLVITSGASNIETATTATTMFTSSTYTMILTAPTATPSARIIDVKDIFFTTLPQLKTWFNTGATSTVTVIIGTYGYTAGTAGTEITINGAYWDANPEDLDVLTHELTHVVQAYPGGAPGHWVEGLADYARWKYGVNNAAAGWNLDTPPGGGASYTDGYRTTARFLVWLSDVKQANITQLLDDQLAAGTYTDAFWSSTLGSTVAALWSEYVAATTWTPP